MLGEKFLSNLISLVNGNQSSINQLSPLLTDNRNVNNYKLVRFTEIVSFALVVQYMISIRVKIYFTKKCDNVQINILIQSALLYK